MQGRCTSQQWKSLRDPPQNNALVSKLAACSIGVKSPAMHLLMCTCALPFRGLDLEEFRSPTSFRSMARQTTLGPIVLMVRDVTASKAFYTGLGLKAAAQLEDSLVSFGARLCGAGLKSLRTLTPLASWCHDAETGCSVPLVLRAGDPAKATDCIGGSTPIISLHVEDLDSCMAACMPAGAVMDGAIQYSPEGRLAVIRSPDGHMLTLLESGIEGSPVQRSNSSDR